MSVCFSKFITCWRNTWTLPSVLQGLAIVCFRISEFNHYGLSPIQNLGLFKVHSTWYSLQATKSLALQMIIHRHCKKVDLQGLRFGLGVDWKIFLNSTQGDSHILFWLCSPMERIVFFLWKNLFSLEKFVVRQCNFLS